MDEGDLGELLAEHLDRHRVPGATVGVLTPRQRLTAATGVADTTTDRPVTPDTSFSAGSLTKVMVATAVALLAAEGWWELDDPVPRHVPEVATAGWARTATLRDLMANRSGAPLGADLEFGFEARPEADDGAVARLSAEAGRDRGSPPGTWSYSNLGWCLLGRALEVALGTSWEAAMRSVLEPAGLTATAFGVEAAVTVRATGHEVSHGRCVPVPRLGSRAYGPAGVGTATTVDDLLRLAGLHLEQPELALLREVHSTVSIPGWLDAWCLGMARFSWEGGHAWGWDGMVGGERAALRMVPSEGVAVAVLTNGSNGRPLHRTLLADLVPQVSTLRPPGQPLAARPGDGDDLSRFAGTYAWPDRAMTVSARSGVLCVTAEGREVEAQRVDARSFLMDPDDPDVPTITFGGFDRDGVPSVLYDMMWGLPRRRAPMA